MAAKKKTPVKKKASADKLAFGGNTKVSGRRDAFSRFNDKNKKKRADEKKTKGRKA